MRKILEFWLDKLYTLREYCLPLYAKKAKIGVFMSELAPLISDLALILICAGIMTLVFKKLKQPLVLGYVVAGFIASPHFVFTPSVMDRANVQTWADIGVIFLLFALGLEFSFKKIVKVLRVVTDGLPVSGGHDCHVIHHHYL